MALICRCNSSTKILELGSCRLHYHLPSFINEIVDDSVDAKHNEDRDKDVIDRLDVTDLEKLPETHQRCKYITGLLLQHEHYSWTRRVE